MKRVLTKSSCNVWWFDQGMRREGCPPGVHGKLTGVRGDLSGVYGDLDDCDLTDDDRRAGVDVADLIVQTPGDEE